MTPAELSAAILDAVAASVRAGEFDVPVPADAQVERPKSPEYGDYTTNLALRLAKPAARPKPATRAKRTPRGKSAK